MLEKIVSVADAPIPLAAKLRYSGSPLGDFLDGKITVTSEFGQGSPFHVELSIVSHPPVRA